MQFDNVCQNLYAMGLPLGAEIPVLNIYPKMIISQLNRYVYRDMEYFTAHVNENLEAKQVPINKQPND